MSRIPEFFERNRGKCIGLAVATSTGFVALVGLNVHNDARQLHRFPFVVQGDIHKADGNVTSFDAAARLHCIPQGVLSAVVRVIGREVVSENSQNLQAVVVDQTVRPGPVDCDTAVQQVRDGTGPGSMQAVLASTANRYGIGAPGEFITVYESVSAFAGDITASIDNGAQVRQVQITA